MKNNLHIYEEVRKIAGSILNSYKELLTIENYKETPKDRKRFLEDVGLESNKELEELVRKSEDILIKRASSLKNRLSDISSTLSNEKSHDEVYDIVMDPKNTVPYILNLSFLNEKEKENYIDEVISIKNERILLHQLIGMLLSIKGYRLIGSYMEKEVALNKILKSNEDVFKNYKNSITNVKRYSSELGMIESYINGDNGYNICKHSTKEVFAFLDSLTSQLSIYWYQDKSYKIVLDIIKEKVDHTFNTDMSKLLEIIEVIIINAAQELCLSENNNRKLIRVFINKKECFIEILIEDNGRGIEEPEKIFDINYSTKIDKGGTGIGLAVSKKYANDMNIELNVETKLGTGTVFKIKIPIIGGNNAI